MKFLEMKMDNPKQHPKRMMLFCEFCTFKKIIESKEEPKDLTEIKTSPVQTNIPILDPKTNKVINAVLKNNEPSKAIREQQKKYKCPDCGRGVKLRDLLPSYAAAFDKVDKEKEKQRIEEQKQKRIEDGLPNKRQNTPFLG